MQKIPVYFVKPLSESDSIIESDKGGGEVLGGRADKHGHLAVDDVAMTPPIQCEPFGEAELCSPMKFKDFNNPRPPATARAQDATPAEAEPQVPQSEIRPFFGARDAAYEVIEEKPHHRVMIYMAAAGDTPAEIADKTGFRRPTVGYILKQPWALKQIAELQEAAGRKGVMNVLHGASLNAARRLIAIAEGNVAGSKISDSVTCAKEILNRCYGTAPQVILSGKVDPEELSDAELAAVVKEN